MGLGDIAEEAGLGVEGETQKFSSGCAMPVRHRGGNVQ